MIGNCPQLGSKSYVSLAFITDYTNLIDSYLNDNLLKLFRTFVNPQYSS